MGNGCERLLTLTRPHLPRPPPLRFARFQEFRIQSPNHDRMIDADAGKVRLLDAPAGALAVSVDNDNLVPRAAAP